MFLSRHLNLDQHTPSLTVQQGDSSGLTATETIDSTTDLTGRPVKGGWIKDIKVVRIGLLVWTLFGASAVMADGLLTPAVSVISAVTGISSLVQSLLIFRHRSSRSLSQ
jgi:K+ potassium transporter